MGALGFHYVAALSLAGALVATGCTIDRPRGEGQHAHSTRAATTTQAAQKGPRRTLSQEQAERLRTVLQQRAQAQGAKQGKDGKALPLIKAQPIKEALKAKARAARINSTRSTTTTGSTTTAGKGHKAGGKSIKWDGPIDWQTWEAGLATAKAGNKPICLVVYADWCPRCRELAPAFKDPELVQLADSAVMIRQNADERPDWLTGKLGQYGGYVPRVLLMNPDGTVREDLTSGNPRYPYFYMPSGRFGLDTLKANLRSLIKS